MNKETHLLPIKVSLESSRGVDANFISNLFNKKYLLQLSYINFIFNICLFYLSLHFCCRYFFFTPSGVGGKGGSDLQEYYWWKEGNKEKIIYLFIISYNIHFNPWTLLGRAHDFCLERGRGKGGIWFTGILLMERRK